VVAVGVTDTAVPEVAGKLPGVITPEPPLKVGVRLTGVPDVTVEDAATSEVATGGSAGGGFELPPDDPPPPPPQANVKAMRLVRAIDERNLWKRLI
jgi:hypothetical protein